jgi:putative acyl-CoA dehydrogenase
MNTHDVFNQSPPLADFNPFLMDVALQEAVQREGASAARDALVDRGREIGSARMIALADAANRNTPVLKLFDATGQRRDVVEFHPAYHELMSYLARHGAAVGPWVAPSPGAHAARAALYYLYAQVEDGTLCPTTMTYASVPALREDPALPRRGCRSSRVANTTRGSFPRRASAA